MSFSWFLSSKEKLIFMERNRVFIKLIFGKVKYNKLGSGIVPYFGWFCFSWNFMRWMNFWCSEIEKPQCHKETWLSIWTSSDWTYFSWLWDDGMSDDKGNWHQRGVKILGSFLATKLKQRSGRLKPRSWTLLFSTTFCQFYSQFLSFYIPF